MSPHAASIAAAFDHAWASGPVNIVVNNAGMTAEPTLLKMTEEIWDQVMDTNLKGAWLVAREAVGRLADTPEPGRLHHQYRVNPRLRRAERYRPRLHGASKAGLLHLNRIIWRWSVARYNIRVNAIAPGYFATDLAEDFLATDFATNMIINAFRRRSAWASWKI